MATLEQLTTAAQAEIDAKKTVNGGEGMFAQVNNERREFTEAEYAQAVTDLANFNWDEQQFGYIKLRLEAYGSLGDQLDMQYKDILNDTTTWKDHIAAVKAAHPKP
jgi:hypothetical protein